MEHVVTKIQSGDEIPYHLLLLADENQQLIDTYLPASHVYLLKIKDQVQGICLLQINDQTGEIMNVAIEPVYQGKGLGKALLSRAIEFAQQESLQRLVIKTGNCGIRQIALYQELGFDLVQVNYNYFLRAYSQPIWENNIQCKHQLFLN